MLYNKVKGGKNGGFEFFSIKNRENPENATFLPRLYYVI